MRWVALLCVFSLASLSCRKSTSDINPLVFGKWKMVAVDNLKTGATIIKDSADVNRYCRNRLECDVVLEIRKINNRVMVAGHTIMNTLNGELALGRNNTIDFISVFITQAGDPEWSDQLIGNLYLIETYEASPGILSFYSADRTLAIRFVRQ
jgi:hypothetical protein